MRERAGWYVRCLALLVLAFGVVRLGEGDVVERDVVELIVDAKVRVGRVRPTWDEVNLWKLLGHFGVHHADPAEWWGPGWLRGHAPWVRYGRVQAALGGNYAPGIARWCDHGETAPEHPYSGAAECGHGGEPGSAAANELVRDADGRVVIDYGPFRTAVVRLLESGVLPHLNLSAAPAAFTGDTIDFTLYNWNSAPVRDLDGWRAFVAGAFRAVADLDPAGWRVSIVNEPNSLTLIGWQKEVRHIGFAGTPQEYARMFADAAAAIRAAAPAARIHAGNYVTSDTFPGENNLVGYLVALRDALAANGQLTWEDLAAVSLSLYETPDTSVYDFVPVRIARLEAAERAAGLAPLPVKVDELEIHPVLVERFNAVHRRGLDTTLFAASWHAEALRALLAAGNVVSVAPWLSGLFALPSWAPFPKARTYELFGLLAGQLRATGTGDGVRLERTEQLGGLPRLGVAGEVPRSPDARRPGRDRTASIGALATRTRDGLRVLIVHHQNRPVPDRAIVRRALGRVVRVLVRSLPPGAYTVRHLSIGGPEGSAWDGVAASPLGWTEDGCRVTHGGPIELLPLRRMHANTVWLFEAVRHPRCPALGSGSAPGIDSRARRPSRGEAERGQAQSASALN
jgi:hypothetical protein